MKSVVLSALLGRTGRKAFLRDHITPGSCLVRRLSSVRAAVVVAVLVLVLLLSGCGGRARRAATTSRSQTTTSAGATSTSNTSTPPTATTTTAAVPAGFAPLSFTAVSDDDFWVLGTYPCAAESCAAIAATTDGGHSFTTVPAPDIGALAGRTPILRFADTQDGWLFIPNDSGSFFVTHDGGQQWQRLRLGTLVAFASGGGYTYAVTAADCNVPGCAGFEFRRSPVSRDAWTSSAMPFTPDGSVLDLSAHGGNVWLLGTGRAQTASRFDLLARSTDAGKSFRVSDGPCTPGLGGQLEPSSASVVWAVCPTGTLAGAARSTDGGLTFAPLHTPAELPNSTLLAPASDNTALLLREVAPPLLTTDGGASWTTLKTSAPTSDWLWAGFTDAGVGAAIVQNSAAGARAQLWRTTAGGAQWTVIPFR